MLAKARAFPPSTPRRKAYFAQYDQNTHGALNDIEDAPRAFVSICRHRRSDCPAPTLPRSPIVRAPRKLPDHLLSGCRNVGGRALRACAEAASSERWIALGPVRLHAVGLRPRRQQSSALPISPAAAARSAATTGSSGRWRPSRRSRCQCAAQRSHAASRKNFAALSDEQNVRDDGTSRRPRSLRYLRKTPRPSLSSFAAAQMPFTPSPPTATPRSFCKTSCSGVILWRVTLACRGYLRLNRGKHSLVIAPDGDEDRATHRGRSNKIPVRSSYRSSPDISQRLNGVPMASVLGADINMCLAEAACSSMTRARASGAS